MRFIVRLSALIKTRATICGLPNEFGDLTMVMTLRYSIEFRTAFGKM